MKDIAVLLTCFNRKNKTIKALEALFAQKLPESFTLSVFLVDDGSTDGTSDEIEVKFPKINIIKGNGQMYWNRGMRLAWKEASKKAMFDYFLWLNDDTNIFPNSLVEMLQISEDNRGRSIVVGAICTNDKKGDSYGGYKSGKLLKPTGDVQECEEFNGNCVLIPDLVFKEIGGFDEYFRHSFGDIEYGRRARKEGVKIYLTKNYIGACDRNAWPPKFLSKEISCVERFKILYAPLGFNPFESFYLNRKYKSIFYAIAVFVKLHLNVIFPGLVKRKL